MEAIRFVFSNVGGLRLGQKTFGPQPFTPLPSLPQIRRTKFGMRIQRSDCRIWGSAGLLRLRCREAAVGVKLRAAAV